MRRFRLTDSEFDKISVVTGVSSQDLSILDSMGLLSPLGVVNALIRFDYNKLNSKKVCPSKMIIDALACKYGLTYKQTRAAVFPQEKTVYYCKRCNLEISRSHYYKYKGLCYDCAVANINP